MLRQKRTVEGSRNILKSNWPENSVGTGCGLSALPDEFKRRPVTD